MVKQLESKPSYNRPIYLSHLNPKIFITTYNGLTRDELSSCGVRNYVNFLFDEGSNGMASVLNRCVRLLAVSLLVGSVQGCVSDPALNKALGLSSVPASKQAYAAKHKKPPVKTNKKKKGKKAKIATTVSKARISVPSTSSNTNAKYFCNAEAELGTCNNSYDTLDSFSCDKQKIIGAGTGVTKELAGAYAVSNCTNHSILMNSYASANETAKEINDNYKRKFIKMSDCKVTQCF
jgi:hypothetical protein